MKAYDDGHSFIHCAIYTVGFRSRMRTSIDAKAAIPGTREIRCHNMLWCNFVDVGWYLDPISHKTRAKDMLCLVGVVCFEFRTPGTCPTIGSGRVDVTECIHDIYSTLHGELDRPTPTNCSFKNGVLSSSGHCIIGE